MGRGRAMGPALHEPLAVTSLRRPFAGRAAAVLMRNAYSGGGSSGGSQRISRGPPVLGETKLVRNALLYIGDTHFSLCGDLQHREHQRLVIWDFHQGFLGCA